jgi:hypothetical protein
MTPGTFDLNAGFTAAGNHYLCPAAVVMVSGCRPAFTRLIAVREPCRTAVDAPGHIADLERYRDQGYRMAGNRIAVVTDHPVDLVGVHPPSHGAVDLGGLTGERSPPDPMPVEGKCRPACLWVDARRELDSFRHLLAEGVPLPVSRP